MTDVIAKIEKNLPASAEKVWGALQRKETFLFITRGMLGFSGSAGWPERFTQGLEIQCRMWFMHLVPGWRHYLNVISIDHDSMELVSNERGGAVRRWNHSIRVKPDSSSTCHYEDEIDIDAGAFTPLIWLYAHVFYRYRQQRWVKLLRKLGD
jgi:hypothetical protein